MIDSMTHTTYTVVCDLCGNRNRSRTSGLGVQQMLTEAHAAGWVLAHGPENQDICHRCVPTLVEACS